MRQETVFEIEKRLVKEWAKVWEHLSENARTEIAVVGSLMSTFDELVDALGEPGRNPYQINPKLTLTPGRFYADRDGGIWLCVLANGVYAQCVHLPEHEERSVASASSVHEGEITSTLWLVEEVPAPGNWVCKTKARPDEYGPRCTHPECKP